MKYFIDAKFNCKIDDNYCYVFKIFCISDFFENNILYYGHIYNCYDLAYVVLEYTLLNNWAKQFII